MHEGKPMRLMKRLRPLFGRSGQERDLSDELRFHIDMKTDENIAAGMSPEEARYAAVRAFGNPGRKREEARAAWGWTWLEHLGQDLRYGLRAMRQAQGFTAVAVLSLALGIGANTAIFSLVDAVLLKMLPVQNPRELALLNWSSHTWPESIMSNVAGDMDEDKTGGMTSTSFSYAVYDQIHARSQTFSSVLALAGNGSDLNVGYEGVPGRADGELVSGTFFSTLGVVPILGRAITPDDDRLGAPPVAVISYEYWQRRFGRDPGVVGRKFTVNSVPFSIAGVCPQDFYGVQPGRSVEVWLPLHAQPLVEPNWTSGSWNGTGTPPAGSLFAMRDQWWLLIMGRLKPGITQAQARSELEVLLQQAIAPDIRPSTKAETIPHLRVLPADKGLNDLRSEFSKPLFILMTVVALVLLIACSNVANMQLARSTTRHREIAVRLAIGAGRKRLIGQLLTESMLLAATGGALGLLFAFWGTRVLMAFMSSGRDPVRLSVTPDLRVLGFTAIVSLLTGILFGLSPALRTTRVDLTPALKESGDRSQAGVQGRYGLRSGLGRTLVIVQVGLSLLLLVGAGLFVRTLTNLGKVNTGFERHNLLLFGIDPTQDGYRQQRLADFYLELARRIEVLAGVRSVSASNYTMIGGGGSVIRVHILGDAPKPGEKNGGVDAWINAVGPHFFETMGMPLVLGRSLNESDTEAAPGVAVVNQEFVRRYLGAGNPLGKRLGSPEDSQTASIEIVGVVGDAKFNDLRQEIPPTVYRPFLQGASGQIPVLGALGAMRFEVRTAGDPIAMVPAVRRVAQAMDPNLALYDVRSQTEQINETLFQERLFARLTGFFGGLALVLGCIGVYGVMAFAVTRRTREIGIRMALGANRGEIVGMVLRETLALVTIGVALGIVATLETSRLVASFLFGLKPNDPLTIAGAALLMVAAAAFAGYVPARRASRVDPMVALRYE